ncbi:MAG: hypothetical protein ABEJ28_09865 [Salinigranum sp.]
MRVAVDVDDVLADRVGGVLGRIYDRHGVELRRDDVDEWEYTVPGTDVGIDDVIEGAAADDPNHLLDLSPIDGALGAVRELAADHTLVIATHRPPSQHVSTRRWLDANGVPYDEFVEECGRGKCAVDADVLIDDRPLNVRTFARERGWSILFRRPWNAAVAESAAVDVAADWAEALRLVRERTRC